MSEQVANTEEPEVTQAEEQQKATGTEKIDFDKIEDPELRDLVQARFKRVYGHMKENERTVHTLVKDQKALIEKVAKLESGQVQDRAQRRIESINAQTEAAIEAGDVDKAKQLQKELNEFVNQSIEEARKPKEEPEPEKATIPPEVQDRLASWASEVNDDTGEFVRPYFQQGHPKFSTAVQIGEQVYAELRGDPLDDVLAEIDRRVRSSLYPKKPARTQTVLDADQGITPKTDKGVKLSDAQKQVARMMFSDRTPEEAEKAYAQALKEV